jgi:hypothetical protein
VIRNREIELRLPPSPPCDLISKQEGDSRRGAKLKLDIPVEAGSTGCVIQAPAGYLIRGPLNSMTKARWVVFLVVWAVSVGYMASHLKRGWVPHDEGTLGQSAERVLNGELPHRDFDDYTGGLTFVHALAFRAFGISSASMRIVLFAFFVPWIPAIFYMASCFGSSYSAGAVTLLAVAWSVPNYPAPMPSWYNLFFATFGAAALFRYVEVGSRRWLYFAGICGGLSILAKITGTYYIAGVFLFFIFREQTITNEKNRQSPARARFYSLTVALSLAVFLALLFGVIHKVLGNRGIIYFVMPTFGLVVLLLARELAGIAGHNRERFTTLVGMCLPFGMGIAIPLIVFLVPYVLSGTVLDLVHGVVAAPMRAVRFAVYAPEDPTAMFAILPFILPVIIAYECQKLGRAIWGCLVVLFTSAILIFSARSPEIYGFGWRWLTAAIPMLVLAGVIAIYWVSHRSLKLNLIRQQQIILIMCVAALCNLMQFPLAPGYFWYIAPFLMLLAAALSSFVTHPPRFVLGALMVYFLLFAVLRITPSFFFRLGSQYAPDTQTERLLIPRAGGLRVDPSDAELYDQLIPLVQSHAEGRFIYAAPDCPEVYFLSGLRSPTRHYFDFAEEPAAHTQRVLSAIDNLDIRLVTINLKPRFSGPMDAELRADLDQRFPDSAQVGHFEVRWKD